MRSAGHIAAASLWTLLFIPQPSYTQTNLEPKITTIAPPGSEGGALPQSTFNELFRARSAQENDLIDTYGGTSPEPLNLEAVDALIFGQPDPKLTASGLEILRTESANGSAAANLRLGASYELGIGVAKDQRAAFAHYLEAAQKDLPAAQQAVGRAYLDGLGVIPNHEASYAWLSDAFSAGNREAAFGLALHYQFGLGVEADHTKSEAFWREAAQTQLPAAHMGYAAFLADAKGKPVTDPDVREQVEMAATLDPSVAGLAFDLAVHAKDEESQKRWVEHLKQLSSSGDVIAIARLGDAYGNQDLPFYDPGQAFQLYKQAANWGDAYAQARMGAMLLNSPDLDPTLSSQAAKTLVIDAAKRGEAAAYLTLARLAEEQGDNASAFSFATTAAEIGGPAYSDEADSIRLTVCAEDIDEICEPVPVFYITNREVAQKGELLEFENKLADGKVLSMGVSYVSIPTTEQVSTEEKGFFWTLANTVVRALGLGDWQPPPPHAGAVQNTALRSDISKFLNEIEQVSQANNRKRVVVFIHGFANTFDDAARRLALISEQFKYPGIPLLLSWASAGESSIRVSSAEGYSGVGYVNDFRTVARSCPDFKSILEEIIDVFGSENVTVVAHSMGGQLLHYILSGCPSHPVPWTTSRKIQNVVLAAPDVGVDEFEDTIDAVRSAVDHLTLYASANDAALRISQEIGGARRRLGQGGPARFIAPGIMTIDATSVENQQASDAMNHSYVFDVPQVKRDLSDVLRGEADPDVRPCTKSFPDPTSGQTYWQLQPNCTM